MNNSSYDIIFLSQNPEESLQAKKLYEGEAAKSELACTASSGEISELALLQNQTSLIVILQHDSASQVVHPQCAATIEYWNFKTAGELPEALKKNIANVIVRQILKGGKRMPTAAPTSNQTSSATASKAAAQAPVRVGLESKGRGGKKVSVVSGLPLNDEELEALTTALKRSCGTGGTFKDGQIEIQGDHRDKLMGELQKLGYKPKRKGG